MKLFLYVKILILIFINSLLFAASLGGKVIIDNNDHVFNFNGKTLTIEDAGNTFGSVTVTSTGSFVFPNKVNDNKSHAYSIKLVQKPDTTQYRCTVINNKVTGIVYIYDNNDIVISCKGKYYISVNVSGLSNGDTYTLTYNNQTLSINTNSTETFPQWFYTNFTYSFNPTFNYTTSDYKRCSNNTNGTIANNLTIYIVCNTSTFNQVDPPQARNGAVSWKDSSGNAYMFGGFNGITYLNDLWKFNGTEWSEVTNAGTPPSVRFGAVSWTDNAGNAYVFGGYSASSLSDLWKFNGTSWSEVTNAGTPPSVRYGAVAWTDNAGNVYVFGGYNGTSLNDLWKFNGTSWSPVNNTDGGLGTPSVRADAVSWTDNAGNAYVFGGRSGNSYLNDLWRFNGTSWSPVTIAGTAPSVRSGAVSWKDSSGNFYVFGGFNGTFYLNDLWMFNGTSWSQVTIAGTPPSVRIGAVAWTDNAGNAYVFGGSNSLNVYNDLWKFTTNNTTWTKLTNVTNAPSVRYGGAVAWKDSSGNAYIFGGFNGNYLNDLWRFNGTSWFQVTNADGGLGKPSVRSGAVSWKDSSGNAYVFGGRNANYLNDLWRFNGTSWSPVTNTDGGLGKPSVRSGAVAWTDNAGNAYVFGGYNSTSSNLNDLWRFNGTMWSPVTNAGTPPSVRIGAVAWTDNAGNAYVFGGYNGISYLNDLWKFNGTWSPVTNTDEGLGTPSVRIGAVSWTDNAGNAYVFGGYNVNYLNDLWRFNGTMWSPVTNAGTPPSVRYVAVAWTDNVGNAYVFGGGNDISYLNDLYVIK